MIKKNAMKKRYLKKNIFITYLNVPGETLLLADVFENSRNMCINIYELDPSKFLSSPGLAWQAALKKYKLKLNILSDIDVINGSKRYKRGTCHFVYRYEKVNNKYMRL